jgi:predicted DNA-binding WGR domain protein
MRRFELSDGTSNKFWRIGQDGSALTVCYGKIGTAGTSQCKSHPDAARAGAAMDTLIREKTAKGYVEVASPASSAAPLPVPTPLPLPAPTMPAASQAPAQPAEHGAPWLAAGVPIAMPAAFADQALPSRRFPGRRPNPDGGACWSLFLAHARSYPAADPAHSHTQYRAAVGEAMRRIEHDLRSGSALSDAVLLALSTRFEDKLTAAQGAPLLDFLVADKGLGYALEVLLLMERMSIREQRNRYTSHWYLSDETDIAYGAARADFGRTELAARAHLAWAPHAEWERCAQLLRDGLPTLPIFRQPLCALLLPDLPELSDALILALARDPRNPSGWLRLTARAPASLAAVEPFEPADGGYARKLFYDTPSAVAALVRDLGVDAVAQLRDAAGIDAAGDALACIGTPDAMRALGQVCHIGKKSLQRLTLATQRWPLAALAGLAELLASDPAAAPALRSILAKLVRGHAGAVPTLTASIAPAAARLLAELAGQCDTGESAAGESAAPGDLPAVLASPPWMAPPRPAAKALTLATLALAPRMRWTEAQRQRLLADQRYKAWPYDAERCDGPRGGAAAIAAGDVDALVALWRHYAETDNEIGGCVHAIADLPAPFNAAVWTAMAAYEINSPGYAFATLGVDSLPALLRMCERNPVDELPYAMYFGAIELAQLMARIVAGKNKAMRAIARSWLLANPDYAACALIATALGQPGAARNAAAGILQLLAEGGQRAVLLAMASRYQRDDVDAAMRALLDQDPLERYPARRGPLPAFWLPHNWPRPRLAAGAKVLPDSALDALGTMLRFPQDDAVYAGLHQVRAACRPDSLAAFAWALFSAWLDAGADPKENWAYGALRVFGDDEVARKLTPLIRAWPGESQHARAVAGLDVLAAIGSDTALMLLNGIAHKVKFKGLQDNAREKIAQIAEARNLGTEELEDRLVPDLGLDRHASLLLDFGARQFRIGFDETLKPFVRDQDGAHLADLPKPKKSDDAALAEAAQERYKLLKKDARAIAAQQVARLEAAMCSQRRWQAHAFVDFLVHHPLLRHLVQRLVWGVYEVGAGAGDGGRLLACLRVDADGAFSDAADAPLALPQGDRIRIGIPHALELPAADAAAFGQLFADYELMQPFVQLGRHSHALDADELGATALTRWNGITVPTGRLLGMTSKGWRRGRPLDGGSILDLTRELGAGRVLNLRFSPGIIAGLVDEFPEQTLKRITVGQPGTWGDVDRAEPLSTLDPVVASELIRDMRALCA